MDQLRYYVALAADVYKWTDTSRWYQGSFIFWAARIYDSLPPIGFSFPRFQLELYAAIMAPSNSEKAVNA